MNLLVAIILGLIQGITEFLPVSSSGHVFIFSRLLDSPSSFEFDVLVSFGTLFAVVIYYRRRLLGILQDIIRRRDLSLTLKILVACIPAVIVGFVLQDVIELYLHSTFTVIAMMLSIGILMVLSKNWKPKSLPVNKDLHGISYKEALIVGLAQCFSLISGSSRSGVTMLAAIGIGFERKVAAEWSFLMSIPIIFGASMKVLLSSDGMQFVQQNMATFLIANLVAFVSGMLAIHILLKILANKGLYWFGWYRIILAGVLILFVSVKIL